MRTIALAIVLIVLGNLKLVPAAGPGDDQVSMEKAIQQWIADWDKPSFSARNEASRNLRDVGDTAFPALVDAARLGSQETIARALTLLKSSLYANDGTLKAAARKSLDQIAAGPNGLAARSAQQVLHDFDRPPSQLVKAQGFGIPNGQMQFGFAGIGPQPNIAGRMNTWTFNGTTTLEAFEPDKRIKFQIDAKGRIKVEITRKRQQGVEVPDKFEAANTAELKTKHPEAHQAYQRYEPSLQQARFIAQRARGMPGVPGMPPVPGIPNFPMQFGVRQQDLQVQNVQIELLKQHIAQAPTPAAADSLNRHLQKLVESRDQLQRELNRNR